MENVDVISESNIRTVAFVDGWNRGDESLEMPLPYWEAEIAGFQTLHVPDELETIEEIVSFIRAHAQAAICTHRLDKPFLGAELVAALYDEQIPAVLVTLYAEIDQYTSLRRWRAKLPVVLHTCELDSVMVRDSLERCAAELQGQLLDIPEQRVPYRVLIQVKHVEQLGNECFVDVHIDCWHHCQLARFPISIIPSKIHYHVKPGSWFFAHVNIHAEYSQDLYFCAFEVAPEPQEEENLIYCVNMLDGSGEAQALDLSSFYSGQVALDALYETTELDNGGDYEIGHSYN